jgi:Flp pilus assembly pilin Flp
MIGAIRRLFNDDKGVTSVEYSLLTALIVIALVIAVPDYADSWLAFTLKFHEAVSAVTG